jgi:co-chaperonin GroES (HSP10)
MSNEIENEYLDFEESDEEENNKINKELTIYKNNSEKIEYFLGHEIAKLLGYKNTKQSIQLNVKEENKISFKNYNGVKEPKINSSVKLITRNGIKDLPSLDITEKCCLFCDDTKPVSEFWKCTREKDGYNPHCVDCAKKLRKTYNNKTIV